MHYSTRLKANLDTVDDTLSRADYWKRERARYQTTLTNKNQHGYCPKCNADFDGGFIWDTGFDFAVQGKHYHQNGIPAATEQEAFKWADEYAQAYGATRYYGKWGKNVGVIDHEKYDGVSYFYCPECKYTWDRFTGKEVKENVFR